MEVGVFLALEPFTSLERNLECAKEAGFTCADITDTHASGSMFASAGLSASVSLDGNPFEIKRTFEKYGMNIMTLSAHASLLEPSSPANFATSEIMKAIKFAAAIGIRDVITTETFAKSEWAKNLSYEQTVFITAEKLYEPCRMAADYGVKLCLEPHGPLTDSITGIGDVMELLGNPEALGVNMDTGNSWLGGTDPVELAKKYKDKIYHIHWKDLGEEWLPARGTRYGCGFSTIEVGTGVIDIKGVIDVLKDRKEIRYSTLEVAGTPELLRASAQYIKKYWDA
ncbi:sugar phosphate isomerase/epimerase family protein [Christensenella tenuis]|uniref:Sugar phosphate isomerase/epimerase n=1 Tax=Christensenella tenuis TaxID=2763033 RepID=A0ABR7EC80_9FIRM|nr:sugar phosphate isomerase/epimerase [Christensenella tenuis]MBC5647380.1 sugar phosphate isomerase/epimerase [Christensenella tenuis]